MAAAVQKAPRQGDDLTGSGEGEDGLIPQGQGKNTVLQTQKW